MRAKKPSGTSHQFEALRDKMNTFFRQNIYVLAFAMVGLNVLTMCSNGSFHDEALGTIKEHGSLLKENLGKVHFLSASGQHVVGDRYEVGYEDDRFKLYVKNVILDNLVQGLAELSNGFSVKFKNGKEINKKNERFVYFEGTFLPKEKDILKLYRDSLYRSTVEGRLPEYISISGSKFLSYSVLKNSVDRKSAPQIEAKMKVKVFLKSWIKELKKWDTREDEIIIPFKAEINVEKYANIGNPFGIRFINIKIPTILKPRASDIVSKNAKRRG